MAECSDSSEPQERHIIRSDGGERTGFTLGWKAGREGLRRAGTSEGRGEEVTRKYRVVACHHCCRLVQPSPSQTTKARHRNNPTALPSTKQAAAPGATLAVEETCDSSHNKTSEEAREMSPPPTPTPFPPLPFSCPPPPT